MGEPRGIVKPAVIGALVVGALTLCGAVELADRASEEARVVWLRWRLRRG